jgi:hypothetical protein
VAGRQQPTLALTVADGAIGSHAAAVHGAQSDFRTLATAVLGRIDSSIAKD